MKINVVSVDDSLISIGARRMSAFIRRLNPDTTPYYVATSNYLSFRDILLTRSVKTLNASSDARHMAEPLAQADIVAFSSMTPAADQTKAVIRELRRINPKAFIIWGGIHPIISPEDAIWHADAICTGEGAFAFEEFFEVFSGGRDYTATRNFWFNIDGRIIRNGFRPLMTPAEMDTLPLPTYGKDELLYQPKEQVYAPLTAKDYIHRVGLVYQTVWSVGCPFRCSYCGNSRFIDNDPRYAKLRHPSPEWVIDEIIAARRTHPHIETVVFEDDSFLALPLPQLDAFARLYKDRVGLPFCVGGVIPNYVNRDKIEVLLEAGLNRVRMGIQSGSRRILEFYKRPTPPKRILQSAGVLADYSKYMIPPAYDFIVDNPIETRRDVRDTLELLYAMPRPFTCNLFSLRVQPNTALADQFEAMNVSTGDIRQNYHGLRPSFANCLLVLLICIRPPRRLFDWLLSRVRPMSKTQAAYPRLLLFLRLAMLTRRAWNHFRFMDFSVIPGRATGFAGRLGIIRFYRRHFLRRFRRAADEKYPSIPIAGDGAVLTRLPGSLPIAQRDHPAFDVPCRSHQADTQSRRRPLGSNKIRQS